MHGKMAKRVDGCERIDTMNGRILLVLVICLLAFAGRAFADGDVSFSGRQIRPGCAVVMHKAYPSGIDPNVDATVFDQQLFWKCRGAEAVAVGTIGAEGSGPGIVTVFYRPKEIVILARWTSGAVGADFQGDIYQVNAFRLEQANDQTTFRAVPAITKAFGDGYDGTLNGKRVTFPYKSAASIRARLAALGL
jgi:hypothetical protein